MHKIEKWRIDELILVLKNLVETLRQGDNREWAHVFEHFLSESEKINLRSSLQIEEFKRLVHNILCCFLEGDSFRRMSLFPEETTEAQSMNKNFHRQKARLYHLLTDLQSRFVEYVH
jgi:hypothetical protein